MKPLFDDKNKIVDISRGLCDDTNISSTYEWIVTNGLGGYASGTVSGMTTRSYHGLLVAAVKPPTERILMVNGIHETLYYNNTYYHLGASEWEDQTINPTGYMYLNSFKLDGTMPVWTYMCADLLITKRVWMVQGENTTYVQYEINRGLKPIDLSLKILVNYRSHHAVTHSNGWNMAIEPVKAGVKVHAFENAKPFYLRSADAEIVHGHTWYKNVKFNKDAERGLPYMDDQLHAATFSARLVAKDLLTLAFSTEETANLDGDRALQNRREYENHIVNLATGKQKKADFNNPIYQQLVRAADQFIVARKTNQDENSHSIIAGYHWFNDWGRDAMIALPGLLLVTGRFDSAANVLRTFAENVNQGMIPNRFPDAYEDPEYNTVDATLWYFEALRLYVESTNDMKLLKELWPILVEIIEWHIRGTRYEIKMDPNDSLLSAGEPSVQLTWMDAKIGDWVVTSRIGKPIEINALWYNAMISMAKFGKLIKKSNKKYHDLAKHILAGFQKFWHQEKHYCFDVIQGPDGDDPTLRPNQLIAVSLHNSPLSPDQQKRVVDICAEKLLTPFGLRSLDPDHPDYVGIYSGGPGERDAAYHQGTVWGWLIGPFVSAHLRVYGDEKSARSFIEPLLDHLLTNGLGTVSEIFDGDPPFKVRGCIAQAWSVAELLRVWQMIITYS